MKFSVIITFALISLTAAQDFRAKNADDAEKLTEDFKKLTPDSPCKDGDQACVNDQFAQCVGGKFALNSCGGGDLKCVVLPLVNKSGTSITCSTEQDRLNRLAEARGQTPPPNQPAKGKGKDNVETPDPKQPPNEQPPPESGKGKEQPPQEQPPPESGKGNDAKQPDNFRAKNADDAEKLTEDFKKLTPDSPCKDGDQACVNDQFAQCVGGKFALNSCGGGDLKCVVLPLVNKSGTSITCSTEQDRLNRLAEARGQTPPPNQPAKGKGKDNVETPDPKQPKSPNEQPPPESGKGKEQPPNQPDQPDQPQQPPKAPENPETPKGKGSLAEIRSKNADEAEKLQEQFKSFTPDQACKDNEIACVDDKLAQCVNNKFSLTDCGAGLKCSVLPLVLKEGTTIACTTEADRLARLDEARKNLK